MLQSFHKINPTTNQPAMILKFVCIFALLCSNLHRVRARPRLQEESTSERKFSDFPNQSDLPPGWDLAPGSLAEFPIISVAAHPVTAIDPWSYYQRLGLYKVMLHSTEKYFTTWGYNNTGNLLWGLPLQFGWQYSSKRLQDREHSNNSSDLYFSPKRWWGAMNYYLAVIPFLGCLEAGLIDKVPYPVYIRPPKNATGKFCTSFSGCSDLYPDLMEKWKNFFIQIKKMEIDDVIPGITPQHDEIIGYLWAAHTTSISVGDPLFKEELSYLSKPEQGFANDWVNIVLMIADMHFQTNFNQTHEQQHLLLPPRMLKPGDRAPFIPDFTKSQNKGIFVLGLLRKANDDSNGLVQRLWHKAMCSPKGRADARDLMMNMILHPEIIPRDLFKIL